MGISWLCEHWESLCGNLMRRVRSPAFVHRADLYHGFASPSHRGEPPNRSLRRVSVSRLKVERRRREWSMVGTPTSIYCCEESLPIRGDPARYFVRPTRTRWRRNNRSPTLPADIFLAGFEPSGPFQEAIGQFVAARQLSGHPVAIFPM